MANHLKSAAGYGRRIEYNAFVRDLRQFHDSRGTPFRHPPRLNGREIDLLLLYSEVTAAGGWRKINHARGWDFILQRLNVPKECINASLAIKHIYIRYLGQYEKIHFHGDDPGDEVAETSDVRGRKAHGSFFPVPMMYNYQQHELSDVLRLQLGLHCDSVACQEYDKLVLSLLSSLPNEVDFALNAFVVLSSKDRHVLHLAKYPRLLDILVAQAGVCSDVNSGLPGLLESNSQRAQKLLFFWESTLANQEIKELLWPWHSSGKYNGEDDCNLFNLSYNLGVRSKEGQRIAQVASVLRNLSFEECNASIMASSPICIKFLLLCAHSCWSCLRQLGFDALSNLCAEMALEPFEDLYSQLVFKTTVKCILGDDRFLTVRGLEMLTGLCKVASNGYMLVKTMDNRVYNKICSLLTVRDIMLLVYTLECLYHVTELGRECCSCVCRVQGIIGTLVSLVAHDAQQRHGLDTCVSVKLVNTPEPFCPTVVTSLAQGSLKPVLHSHKTTSVPIPAGYQELDNESFACSWVKATYEVSSLRSVSMTDVYSEYQNSCIRLGKKGLIGPTQLSNCVRSVFPHVMPRKSEIGSDIAFEGIRRRVHSLPVSIITPIKPTSANGSPKSGINQVSPSVSSSSAHYLSPGSGTCSHSPILKAQLSAPPRSPTATPQQKNLPISKMVQSSPLSPTPSSKDSSSLIKSLLANKVNQNIQRQQQLLQEMKRPGCQSAESADASVKANLKIQQTSQLGAMLGHFDLSKKTGPVSARGPPSSSKRPVLLAAKARINGVQRGIPLNSAITGHSKEGVVTDKSNEVCADHHFGETVNCFESTVANESVNSLGSNVLCPDSVYASGKLMAFEKSPTVEKTDNTVTSTSKNGNQSRIPHASSFTSMPLNSPSLSKCVELAKTQNSELSLFSNVSSSTVQQPQQPSKHKGVLADLLDGKVSKDSLFSMNGIIEKKLDKKFESKGVGVQFNHLSESSFTKTKVADGKASPAGGGQATSSSPLRNCAMTNGDSSKYESEGLVASPQRKLVSVVDRTTPIRPSVITTATSAATKCGQGVVATPKSLDSFLSKYPNTTFSGSVGNSSKSPDSTKEDTDELIGFPRVSIEQLNQLRHKSKFAQIGQAKRPCTNQTVVADDASKKIRLDEAIASLASETYSSQSTPSKVHSVTGVASNCQDQGHAVNGGSSTRCNNTVTGQTTLPVTVQKVQTKLFDECVKVSAERPSGGGLTEKVGTTANEASVKGEIGTKVPENDKSCASKLEFVCEWKNCREVFGCPSAVFLHACKVHAPAGSAAIPCMWENCDQMERQRFSLMTHLQDRHCNESTLQMEAVRRREVLQSGKSSIPPPAAPAPHPGYAPNAALHAIKRHALEFQNSCDVIVEKEDPLTKSIRLTAALILRNLVISSPMASKLVRPYESYLANVAFSNMESSRPIACFLGMLTCNSEVSSGASSPHG